MIRWPPLPTSEPVALLLGAWRWLPRLIDWATAPRERTCVACGKPVLESDPFVRYRGEYYHAEPCLENDPPALRSHNRAASRATP